MPQVNVHVSYEVGDLIRQNYHRQIREITEIRFTSSGVVYLTNLIANPNDVNAADVALLSEDDLERYHKYERPDPDHKIRLGEHVEFGGKLYVVDARVDNHHPILKVVV